MELKDLRNLAGLSECGMSPMPSAPASPATVSMTAASGPELSGMLKDIMSLAGMTKVEPAHLGVVPPPMKMTPEPVKAVGPAASDGEVMRGIVDKMNVDKDEEGEEKKADEAWDNAPESPEPKEPFDAEALANHENPPGAGKGRRTMQPNATVESVELKLWEDYNQFKIKESNNDLKDAVVTVLIDIHNGAMSGRDMIDTIADELGDHFQAVAKSKDATLQQAYMLMRQEGGNAEGDPELQYKIAGDALNLLGVPMSEEKEVEEEKSWFDMDSKERAAHVAAGKSKAHRSGGQPGHGPAPAKTSAGDIKAQAAATKAHTGKSEYKGKEDDV